MDNYEELNNVELNELCCIQDKLKNLPNDESLHEKGSFLKKEMINSFGEKRFYEIKYILKIKNKYFRNLEVERSDYIPNNINFETPKKRKKVNLYKNDKITETDIKNFTEIYSKLISILGDSKYFKDGLDLTPLKNEETKLQIANFKNWYIISSISFKLKDYHQLLIIQKQKNNTWIERYIQVDHILYCYGI